MPKTLVAPRIENEEILDLKKRDKWIAAIQALNAEISQWLDAQPGWSVMQDADKEMEEETLGKYTAPVLRIQSKKPKGELVLEPIGRMTRSGFGRVDLYAWPTLYRVRLLPALKGSTWDVLTDSGIYLHQEWNQENFIRLAKDLIGAG